MTPLRIQLLLLLHCAMLHPIRITSHQVTQLSKPGCPDKCGNTTIPFPFGIEGCSLSQEFLISCDHKFTPPQPFLRNSTIKVTSITIDGHIRILKRIASDCYGASGTRQGVQTSLALSKLTISNTQNKFTVIGCDSYGYLFGFRKGKGYTAGCMSLCDNSEFVDDRSCSGSGCCQIEIPEGLLVANVTASSFYNHSRVSQFNPCTYAFIVEERQFRFTSEFLRAPTEMELPLVLDWAVEDDLGGDNNSVTTVCKNNAKRVKVDNNTAAGYRCLCQDGYDGNPYIGCQDIDECKDKKLNNCTDGCVNLDGGYKCTCPKGYRKGVKEDGQHCIPHQFPLLTVTFSVGISLTTMLVASSWVYLIFKHRRLVKLKERFFRQNGGIVLQQKLYRKEKTSNAARIFTAEELKQATNNYDERAIIGKGGFGTVYKGTLSDNGVVAIKKSTTVDQTQIEQFINEVVVLSQINHRNVVKLLGCCLETQVPLLVYEFITNGTLFEHVHTGRGMDAGLSWGFRLRIAAETAGALSYLHSAASVPIIHRDIKTTNILLDANYTAKVSDFGASRLVPLDQTKFSTMVQGTLGYLDPEYLHTSQLTEKSDVYSFGVVLVELLTGRKALSFDRPEEERNLARYFLSSFKEGKLFDILDHQIADQIESEQVEQVAQLAKQCLRLKGEERPSMKAVAMELEGLRTLENHPWIEVKVEEREKLLIHGTRKGDSSFPEDDGTRDQLSLSVEK